MNSLRIFWMKSLAEGCVSLSKMPDKTPEKTAQIKINSLFQVLLWMLLIDANAKTAASVGTK